MRYAIKAQSKLIIITANSAAEALEKFTKDWYDIDGNLPLSIEPVSGYEGWDDEYVKDLQKRIQELEEEREKAISILSHAVDDIDAKDLLELCRRLELDCDAKHDRANQAEEKLEKVQPIVKAALLAHLAYSSGDEPSCAALDNAMTLLRDAINQVCKQKQGLTNALTGKEEGVIKFNFDGMFK